MEARQAPPVRQGWYFDDVKGVGYVSAVCRWVMKVMQQGKAFGFFINGNKSKMLYRNAPTEAVI